MWWLWTPHGTRALAALLSRALDARPGRMTDEGIAAELRTAQGRRRAALDAEMRRREQAAPSGQGARP